MRYVVLLTLLCYTLFGFGSFLMPEDAFKPDAKIEGEKLLVTIRLADSVYLYKEKVKLSLKNSGMHLENIHYPKSELHEGKEIFTKNVLIEATLVRDGAGSDEVTAVVNYQGCSEKGLCYSPIEKEFVLKAGPLKLHTAAGAQQLSTPTVQAASVSAAASTQRSETDTIADTFKSGNIPLILLTFFGFGLLLALTPCVFPMIPILSSIIVSRGEGMNAKKGFVLSLVYVLSMSVAYTLAGVMAGLFGSNIQASMQNPWVLSAFAAVFVVLAISMFGFFEIGLPASLQSRLSRSSDKAGQKGGFAGVAVMGFLSALIVGPCVAPPLAGALVYIGQTGDAVLGGVALFIMSLGMGMPLLLIGIGAGKFMPRPGGWMSSVSKVFGVVMLMIALWMLSRILPSQVIMLLWALLFVISSVYLGTFEALQEKKGWNALFKGFGVVMFIVGASLLLGLISGSDKPLDPLEKFVPKQIASGQIPEGNKATFVKVHSIAELESVMQENRGKKVMLDFYADWCTSCKELEHNTFSDTEVADALQDYVLIQADVTSNTQEEKQLSKKFGVFGPPAMIFFDKDGNNIDAKKLIGYKPPREFLEHLQRS